MCVLAIGCSREEMSDTSSRAADGAARAVDRVQEQFDVATPVGPAPTREEMERERLDREWQKLESFRKAKEQREAAAAAEVASTDASLQFVQVTAGKFGEKLDTESLALTGKAPIRVPIDGDVSGPSVVHAQVLLDRANFSVGALDGRWGKNSAIAVYWFQRENGLEPTGIIDEATFRRLVSSGGNLPPLRQYTIDASDVKGPFVDIPEDVYEQAKLDCLCYGSAVEALAEKFHTTRDLLEILNPAIKGQSLSAGQTLLVPNVREGLREGGTEVAKIVISVKGSYLHAYGADNSLLLHAPTTLGSKYDPSPNETLKISGIAHDPHFHYQPKLFHEVPDDEPEANLQPGPNSPVGVVWMALSKPHYGIHGTKDPDSIGYASSHGCVRLTNWDARDLATRSKQGVIVEFVDPRHS